MKIEIAWSFFIEHITFSYTWKKKKKYGFYRGQFHTKGRKEKSSKGLVHTNQPCISLENSFLSHVPTWYCLSSVLVWVSPEVTDSRN